MRPNIYRNRRSVRILCPDRIALTDAITCLDPFQWSHPIIPGRVVVPGECGLAFARSGELIAVGVVATERRAA